MDTKELLEEIEKLYQRKKSEGKKMSYKKIAEEIGVKEMTFHRWRKSGVISPAYQRIVKDYLRLKNKL